MQVYKATRGGVATVAIKVMTGETGARQTNKILEQQELFQNEIHLLKSCRDKNIVQFLGACMEVSPEPHGMAAGLASVCRLAAACM